MFLLVLSSNPVEAATLIPKRYRHKQLLELMQMLSCIVDFGYKQLPTGKKIKEWIANKCWTYLFAKSLIKEVNISYITEIKYECILKLLFNSGFETYEKMPEIKTAIFRYVKEYAEMTSYESNSELDIDVAISEYKCYLEYKEKQFNKKRCKQ